MNRRTFLSLAGAVPALGAAAPSRRTEVSIRAEQFYIDGRPTYADRSYKGMKIEGLLMNVRAVQATFDDLNPETRARWAYPDTGKWDPERNTREFVAALPEWQAAWRAGLHRQLTGRQSRRLFEERSPGRTRRSIRTVICGRRTWRGWRACSNGPTNWAWLRSSATSTSGRISV